MKSNSNGIDPSISTTRRFNSKSRGRQVKEGQKKTSGSGVSLIIPRWLYCYIPVITTVLAVIVVLFTHYRQRQYMKEKMQTLGLEALDIFANYDKNGDFFLSLDEAEPLLLQFIYQSKDKDSLLNLDVKPGEDSVKLTANFKPLNISTMTKDFEHDLSGNESFTGLFGWQTVAIPSKEFAVSSFKSFLPDSEMNPIPGTVYDIVESPEGMFGSSNLPSDRFYPPRAIGREHFIHRLLSMFHPRPFVIMRFPPQGVKGCVRAVSQDFIEVVIRMHIEFQLNESPSLPFWFTPAQLTGSLIMANDGLTVKHFYMHVPNERRLNVDMEWLTDNKSPENMEVDIGYMPLMEMTSHASLNEMDVKEQEVIDGLNMKWDDEITKTEADLLLEEAFFPFKKIKYYNLSDAFHTAEKESKLVHSILLWGALDDQSC